MRLYFNQCGNRWSAPHHLHPFPGIDNLTSVMTADLLGNGTACLVWSSSLPGDSRRPLRYLDLMGGKKPHLLIEVNNNLGATTTIQYAASTKFYLADKAAGTPWITKLPFPVHVVEQVIVEEKWRETCFSSRYSYHHGYFDGHEREFRGFGRVEQVDTEHYGKFTAGNTASPYITNNHELYQPPIKTITWFHTGAFLSRERILSQFQDEYFRSGRFNENTLPEPDLAAQNLSVEEWREALRACKGMMLRQEIFELDVDALARGEEQRVKLFSTAYHNCHIQRLQPRAGNRHAVFLVTESEAITYHYELDLRQDSRPDPRIAHTLNLRTDSYGNVLESVAVAYPRIGRHTETDAALLPADTLDRIREVQDKPHLVYSENRFTENIDDPHDPDNPPDPDNYRLPLPYEVRTYELTGHELEAGEFYSLADLRQVQIADTATELPYHQLTGPGGLQKRCVEHVRMLYFDRNLSDALPLGRHNPLALPYETYKLALTESLLETILSEKLNDLKASSSESREDMFDRILRDGGYHHFPDEPDRRWWIRSGIAGFAEDAADHFYLPERYTDPFDNLTTLEYDVHYDLFIRSSRDPMGNETAIEAFDFRVLAPSRMRDINDNLTEVAFDTLGLPTAVAIKGKQNRNEGDNLDPVPPELDTATLIRFFIGDYSEDEAREFLGNATARHLYYFGEQLVDGEMVYGNHPACAAGLMRETHVADPGGIDSKLQVKVEYSDGMGQVLMAKAKAEGGPVPGVTPHPALRWITSGKTILNNKGKPVKQYEPYFTVSQRFEEPAEIGVTPILYYDAAGRLIRTEAPDGSYSRVEFTPWFMAAWDASDTVEPNNAWYVRHINGTAEQRHAARMAEHHANTPTVTHLDSLGREVIVIAHNRTPSNTPELSNTPLLDRPWLDEKYATYTHLDAEGKPLWIRDARGNRVMEYIKHNASGTGPEYFPTYDIAGNLLFQHSMDGGDRWMLMDATSQPHYAWDENERTDEDGESHWESRLYHTVYDALRRPLEQRLQIDPADGWQVTERLVYGESLGEAAKARNLRGQVYRHYDPSGLITNEFFDFKGNLLVVTRQLASAYADSIIHWPEDPPDSAFEHETFTQRTQYDALNRMTELQNWHRAGRPPAVYLPQYNQRGLLQSETLTVRGEVKQAIRKIEYDAKGQRMLIEYGNNTDTRYDYDPHTFRLKQLRTTRPISDLRFPEFHSDLKDDRVVQQLNYTYDPAGNITEIYDEAYEPVFFRNQRVEPRSRYIYDALYRLIEATGRENYHAEDPPPQRPPEPAPVNFWLGGNVLRNYTQRYHYDSVGNILQMRHTADRGSWTRNYQYHLHSNRLLATQNGSSLDYVHYVEANAVTLSEQYSYDTHGSMRNLANVSEEFYLHWDTRDMIHALDLGGGGWAYYQYDSNKQRTRKRIERNNGGHTVEERFYLGGMEWYRRWRENPDGTHTPLEEIETHHLFVDDQRVLMVEDVIDTDSDDLPRGVLDRYQYSNHLGSVGLELNGAAQIISYEEYHPYGTTAYQARGRDVKAVAKRYRYTGMERDEESGLSYHTARYYLPWVGRWGSCDPIGLRGGINTYLYSRGDPKGNLDPTGKQPQSAIAGRLAARHPLLGPDFADRLRPHEPDRVVLTALALSSVTAGASVLGARNPYDASQYPDPANQVILDALPDGTAFVGRRIAFEIQSDRMRFNMAMDTLEAARSTTGLGALIGYAIGGEEGARAGMAIESLGMSAFVGYVGVQARRQVHSYRGGPHFTLSRSTEMVESNPMVTEPVETRPTRESGSSSGGRERDEFSFSVTELHARVRAIINDPQARQLMLNELTVRAHEIEAVRRGRRGDQTVAVIRFLTPELNIVDVVAGSTSGLSPRQRSALGPSEVAAPRLTGRHAELEGIPYGLALERGWTPIGLAASNNICPRCILDITEGFVSDISGGRWQVSGNTAVWHPPE
ncbi:toxin TcdB middle/N-terminal domain-containing protein [Nitrosomonas nitrosa]|uniref:toxin TcdB middle/N-terminal domain-containing protein n=1 Tax=Nitrosomonas nitrosa TaxID=52442 RepID=UPI0023BA61FF|nr:toxin TcdB middle/N-terminal domain-containing protein [Nitrosomonas nitrosa]